MRAVHDLTANIQGWLSHAEGECLYAYSRRVPANQAIVELGSWQGKSTCYLAQGSLDGHCAPVYAIDPHIDSDEHPDSDTWLAFQANMQRTGSARVVRPIRRHSWDAVNDVTEPIGLLFVDASHQLLAVQRDLTAWVPKIADGGILAMHDTATKNYRGPRAALLIYAAETRQLRAPQITDSIVAAIKCASPIQEPRWILLRAFDAPAPLVRATALIARLALR